MSRVPEKASWNLGRTDAVYNDSAPQRLTLHAPYLAESRI